MVRADVKYTTKPLSALFRDPLLRAAFAAAEDDGLTGELVETDHPPPRSTVAPRKRSRLPAGACLWRRDP